MKKIAVIALLSIATACSNKTIPISNAPVVTSASKEKTKDIAATISIDYLKEGHALYTTRCSKCHELKNTTTYTAAGWDVILKNMSKRARLNEKQKEQVTAYLHANAKK
jgi:cytochrome c5